MTEMDSHTGNPCFSCIIGDDGNGGMWAVGSYDAY